MTDKEFVNLKEAMKEGYFTCFRTGVWTDSKGKQHNITQGDLEAIEKKFNTSAEKKPPLLFGHKGKEEKGKISQLRRLGDYLLAKAVDVKDNILGKIKEGALKFVSLAINPESEIEHIALTNTPAVEGLLPLQGAFSKTEASGIEKRIILFQFELTPAAENFSNDFFVPLLEEESTKEFQKTDIKFNQYKEVKMPEDDKGNVKKNSPPDSDSPDKAEFEKRLSLAEEEKRVALKKAEDAQNKLAEFQKNQKIEGISAFTKKMVTEGKLFPNEVEEWKNYLLQLDYEKSHHFSKEKTQTQYEFITDFISKLNKRIPLEKIDVTTETKTKQDACFSRINPDDDDLERHEKALVLMKEKGVTYGVALALLD